LIDWEGLAHTIVGVFLVSLKSKNKQFIRKSKLQFFEHKLKLLFRWNVLREDPAPFFKLPID
jgi:hypothetical protein